MDSGRSRSSPHQRDWAQRRASPALLRGLDALCLAVQRPGVLQHHALLDAAAAGLGGDGVRDMRQHARVDLAGARAGSAPAAALGRAVDKAVLFARFVGLVDRLGIRGPVALRCGEVHTALAQTPVR
jgi:hypothetical protein